MEGYEIGLEEEYSQLKSKISTLCEFLVKIHYSEDSIVSDEEYALLLAQFDAMVKYRNILSRLYKLHST